MVRNRCCKGKGQEVWFDITITNAARIMEESFTKLGRHSDLITWNAVLAWNSHAVS